MNEHDIHAFIINLFFPFFSFTTMFFVSIESLSVMNDWRWRTHQYQHTTPGEHHVSVIFTSRSSHVNNDDAADDDGMNSIFSNTNVRVGRDYNIGSILYSSE